MINIAFIPARAGSTGIKDKNLKKVGGISLVKRTFDQANTSGIFKEIIISTDSYRCARQIFTNLKSKDFDLVKDGSLLQVESNIFLHKRENRLAQTLTPIREVIFNLLQNVNYLEFDNFWMLQPTSPFRTKKEFCEIISQIKHLEVLNLNWSSIVSCKLVEDCHPDRMFKIINEYAYPVVDQSWGVNAPRQMLSPVYLKDGGYYVMRKQNLNSLEMLGNLIVPFIREGYRTINIDSIENLKQARKFAK